MDSHSALHQQLEQLKLLVARGLDDNQIELELKQKGMTESEIQQLMSHIVKLRGAMRTRQGSLLVLAGVIILGIGFLSCVAIHFLGGEIGLPLYGVTVLGLILVFLGLMKIVN